LAQAILAQVEPHSFHKPVTLTYLILKMSLMSLCALLCAAFIASAAAMDDCSPLPAVPAEGPSMLQTSSSSKEVTTAKSSSSGRLVYIDMGANWANTLRLYHDIAADDVKNSEHWEVYSFEANPIIQPYVEKFVTYLNGDGAKPALTIPPSGSTAHLKEYGRMFGCSLGNDDMLRQCMFKRFKGPLSALKADPALNSSALVKQRLSEAATPLPADAQKPRFTFIPAAVGATDGMLHLGSVDASQSIRGGAIDADMSQANNREADVIAVDTVDWLIDNFSEDDYIVIKMDVEGSEFDILSGLWKRNKLHLIDLLAYECHSWGEHQANSPDEFVTCQSMAETLRHSQIKTMVEGKGYDGWDSFSTPEKYKPIHP